jgi:hypothetical protein
VAPWKKIIVAVAGAAGNIVLAAIIAWIVYWGGKPSTPGERSAVIGFVDTNSAAYTSGYMMWNVHYNYIPTYTGPGHASIYSGATPRYHGIIGNDMYDRDTKKTSYCVKDTFNIVGNAKMSEGTGMSPRRMIATNIGDELKICTNKQSRVISISLKDRAAILSAGHMAD